MKIISFIDLAITPLSKKHHELPQVPVSNGVRRGLKFLSLSAGHIGKNELNGLRLGCKTMESVRVNSLLIFCSWFALVTGGHAIAGSQDSSSPVPTQTAVAPVQAVVEARQALGQDLAAARKNLQSASDNNATPPEHLVKEVELLERIDLLLGQHHSRLQQANALIDASQDAGQQLARFRAEGLSERPPYSLFMLDALRRQLHIHQVSQDKNTVAVEAAEGALRAAKQAFEERERNRRQVKEALETNDDDSARAALSAQLRHAELESRLASQTRTVRELEWDHHRLNREIDRLQHTLISEKIAQVDPDVQFTEANLQEQIDKIDKEEFDAQRSLAAMKRKLEPAIHRLASVRQRFDRENEPSATLREEVQSARLTLKAQQEGITLHEKHLEHLMLEKLLWERRYRLFHRTLTAEQFQNWTLESPATLKQLNLEHDFQSAELVDLHQKRAALHKKLALAEQENHRAAQWLKEQSEAIASQIALVEASTTAIERARQLNYSLLDMIADRTTSISWSERVASIWSFVLWVWHYELTSIDDRPITVSKVVVGFSLLIVGYILSKRLSRTVGRKVLPKMGVHESAAAALQSITFYILVFTVTLFSLKVVNVPLTAFTVLGGAVAIGVGFGSQNIINNFMSGLIILADRPIRVADLVQLQDLEGVVQHIGARSTRIKNIQNVDIIVPNSAFLQNNVINWTLSDELYRAYIEVGLAYGSPTREATKLFVRAAREHGKVLDKPQPIVLFSQFGDNALIFEIFFWIRMRTHMERRMIESDLRYRIDHLCREADIVIAFPQRDIHLDTAKPLDVRIAEDKSSPTAGPPPSKPRTNDAC
jgi:small-conductance mechanosensitive channel